MGGAVGGAHPRVRPTTTHPGGRRVTGGDGTSHDEGSTWRFWFPAREGGDCSVAGGPPRQPSAKYLDSVPRAGTQPTRAARGDCIRDGVGLLQSGTPSSAYTAWTSCVLVGLVCFECTWGGYFGCRRVGFGKRLLGGQAAFLVAV